MPVALQNAIVTTTVLLYLFSVSATTGFAIFTLSMSSSSAGNSSSPRRSLKKKSVADNMALKIGLNVVPKKKSGYTNNGNDTKTNKVRAVKVPTITWTQNAKNFFWRDNEQSIEKANLRNTSRTTTGVPARQRGERQVQVQVVANKEEFPLYLLRNVLPPKSLARALSIVMDEDTAISDAEEMEQHERVSGGKVRTLRRSIVSRLKCTTDSSKSVPTHVELLNMIVSRLPVELVEGMPLSGSTKDNGNTSIHKSSNSEHDVPTTTHNHSHQYEDGSIVYYRTTGNDFYDTHHDSYAPGDPPRKRQRAYTILLYLRAPPGLPLMGGTEFPRLTPLRQGKTSDSKKGRTATTTSSTRNQPKERLVVKPRPGDALVWPNFDEDGNPHMHSVHRALSIAPSTPPTTISKGKLQADEIARKDKDDDLMGKIVVNLWFEG